MAEAVPNEEKDDDESSIEIKRSKDDNLECAVCLQTCIHPAQLPCGHIFCFLCVKGIANQSKKCAMCRTEIPSNFLEQPNLLQKPSVADTTDGFDGGYQWFYEGRNGWWQYDERTSRELEACYKNGERSCELLIAGFLYVADLEAMLQLRRNDPSRRRRIKRDLANIPKKGIAGLRTDGATQQTHTDVSDDHLEAQRSSSPTIDHNSESLTPTTPSNTPQSPTSGRESPQRDDDLQATMERISSLQLDSNTRSGIMRGVNITENNSNNEENQSNNTDNNRVRNRNRFLYRHRNVD